MTAPALSGVVFALEPDGVGGLWVGGGFATIGGSRASGLGHIDANGIALGYPVANGRIEAISASGSQLYLAGPFTLLAGAERWGVGSIDLSTGAATRWRPDPAGQPGDARGARR